MKSCHEAPRPKSAQCTFENPPVVILRVETMLIADKNKAHMPVEDRKPDWQTRPPGVQWPRLS